MYDISNVDDLTGRRLTLYTLHRDVNRGYTDRPVAKHTPIRPYITRTRHREVDQDSANVRLLLDWRCRRQMGPMKGHASHEWKTARVSHLSAATTTFTRRDKRADGPSDPRSPSCVHSAALRSRQCRVSRQDVRGAFISSPSDGTRLENPSSFVRRRWCQVTAQMFAAPNLPPTPKPFQLQLAITYVIWVVLCACGCGWIREWICR